VRKVSSCVTTGHHDSGIGIPPKLNVLLAWSTLFRNAATWKNYLGYVKTACMLTNAPVKVSRAIPHVVIEITVWFLGIRRSCVEKGNVFD